MKDTAYWICQVLGWGGYTAIAVASAAARSGSLPLSVSAGYFLFFLYSMALTDLFRREIRRREWLTALSLRTVSRLFLGAVSMGVIQTFLVISIYAAFQGGLGGFGTPIVLGWLWLSVTGASVIWTLLYVAITMPRRYREKSVRLELALREAELRALEAQINPHFLFNCLNSIRASVAENPGRAQDMITRFANILRYNLNRDLAHTVPLEDEVEIVMDYLALESIRFEDRLRVRFEIDAQARPVPVPPMLLQALVENALKHGIARLPEGGEIVVHASVEGDVLELQVENTGHLGDPAATATQVGLSNTRERLRILYGDRARFELKSREGGRVAATVLIPKTA